MISRKKVEEITYWNEARGFREVPRFGMPKQYMFFRVNRDPLSLSNIYEDFDGLIDLIRQHIPKQL
ncbi:hypothetical protein KSZ_12150 [Dictyobacter formicarum]|uniref:Uncharacterized protein n=2 Tax=Dictyobacter formicarum TaxID=2778368 RepID=A0ABQ3VBP1_9CHLR|nr:hypothetical protein KSZ_12150 [Dictyobacter formicarum]